MRKLQGVLAATLAMGLLVVLALAFIVLFRNAGMIQSVPGAVPPSATHCAPTPVLWVTSPPSTPLHVDIGPVTRVPSATPLPIVYTTDMAPNIPNSDKGRLIVMHCDGTLAYVWYLTPVALQPGDVILDQAPAASSVELGVAPAGTQVFLPTTTGTPPTPRITAPTAAAPAATAGPVTGYPAPVATLVGVGSPYPTPSNVPTVAPTPALPPLADSPDQFDPKTYGLPDTIAGYTVLGVKTPRNTACVFSGRKTLVLQSKDPTVQDALKNDRTTDVTNAMAALGFNTTEWDISIGGPNSTRAQLIADIQQWNRDRQKWGCVSSGGPAIPAATPTSQNP